MTWRTWKPWAGLGIAAIAVLGAVVSAIFLSRLALRTGVPANLGWTLPVVVDLGGGVATLVWIKGEKPVQGWARGVALGSLGATIVGNSVSHLIEAGIIPVTVWLVIGVGAVYPAILWLMIHLLALSGHSQARSTRPARPADATRARRRPTTNRDATTTRAGDPGSATRRPDPTAHLGDSATRPTLHAVTNPRPDPPTADQPAPDVSDLLEHARDIVRALGKVPGREVLVQQLRGRGLAVGGRRRAAIHAAMTAEHGPTQRPDPSTSEATGS